MSAGASFIDTWSRMTVERMRERMARRSLSVPGLSLATGIPVSTLRRRFAEPGRLSFTEIEAVAQALDVRILELVPQDAEVEERMARA